MRSKRGNGLKEGIEAARKNMMRAANSAAAPMSRACIRRFTPVTANASEMSPMTEANISSLLSCAEAGDVLLLGSARKFIHGAVYVGAGKMIHATQTGGPEGREGVVEEPLARYVQRKHICRAQVLRLHTDAPGDRRAMIDYAKAQVGKPYDYLIRTRSPDAFYCTELPWAATQQACQPPRVDFDRVFRFLEVVSAENLRQSPDLDVVWSHQAEVG